MNKSNSLGIIIKATGGFYYVEKEGTIYECKARGVFRKDGVSPVVGDHVHIEVQKEGYASIAEICERKNYIVRPPLANIDNLIVVVSTTEPEPNPLIIDKMIAAAESRDIEPIIVFTKTDLKESCGLEEVYANAGFKTFISSEGQDFCRDELIELLKNKTTALTGNSGVGKSTFLNRFFSELNLETGDISKKLGRGRHTTRTVELFKLDQCYIADTPGFSTFDMQRYNIREKEKLQYCFREFNDYIDECRFIGCAHINEPDCGVKMAVDSGNISRSRYNSYIAMYDEIKDIKSWMK